MLKKIIFIGLLLISSFSICQTNIGNELSAEGNSKIKIKPDIAVLKVTVEKTNFIEKIAIKELNDEIEKLQKVLFKIGFTEKNIKISEFKISSGQNNNKKEYTTTNTLVTEFVLDNKIIDAFYQEVENGNLKDLDVEFETQISVELEKTTRQKLIQLAIQDAKINAENIANALDVKITNVKQVSKSFGRVDVSYYKAENVKFIKPMAMMAPRAKTSFEKFEVEEKEIEEMITIVYEIIKK